MNSRCVPFAGGPDRAPRLASARHPVPAAAADHYSGCEIHVPPYSRDKSAAEALLDEYEQRLGSAAIPVARMRPGFILHRAAASGLIRYGLPNTYLCNWFRGYRFCRLIGAYALRSFMPMASPTRSRG